LTASFKKQHFYTAYANILNYYCDIQRFLIKILKNLNKFILIGTLFMMISST